MFSSRYLNSCIKSYDGLEKGSSSLWSFRMVKAYGCLPTKEDHDIDLRNVFFDYTKRQISIARKFRSGFYQRLLKPEDICTALYYSPVCLDMDIFDSIWSDNEGYITLPDEEDRKEKMGHSVGVMKYDDLKKSFLIDTHWNNWGNKGYGFVSLDYLTSNFVTAFVGDQLVRLRESKTAIKRDRVKIGSSKFYISIFSEKSMSRDQRLLYNIEVHDSAGILAGWAHLAIEKRSLEILDIFILKEYRRQGLASFLLNKAIKFTNCNSLIGFISGHDLINDREEIVKDFFLKNGFTVASERSVFRDSKLKILKL